MSLTVTVVPGKQFAEGETITTPKLNQLGLPTFTVTGTVSTTDLTDSSVTAAKTVAGPHFYTSTVAFANGDYTITLPGDPPVVDGFTFAFKASADGVPNVTPAPGTGIRLIIGASTKKLFKNKTQPIAPGDIVLNQIIEARFDSAGDGGNGAWQMTSQLSTREIVYDAVATGTNAYSLTLTPPLLYPMTLADLAGKVIAFKVPNANTGPVQLAVNIGGAALVAKNLYKHFNLPLAGNDLRQNQIAYFTYETTSDAYQLISQIGNAAADSIAVAREVVIQNNLLAPNTKMDLSVAEAVLRSTTGVALKVAGVSVIIDIDTTVSLTGNGRDYGGAEANVWHFIWLISTGTITAGLLSQSLTDPTLPTGFIFKALLGAVYNNTDLQKMVQHDRYVWIEDVTIFFNKTNPAGPNTYALLTAADHDLFRNTIPPIAKGVSGSMGCSTNSNATQMSVSGCNSDGTVNAVGFGARHCLITPTANAYAGFYSGAPFGLIPVRGTATNYNIQWKSRVAALDSALHVSSYTI